jgi:succinoglycan biosynthesis transport protein ExoP
VTYISPPQSQYAQPSAVDLSASFGAVLRRWKLVLAVPVLILILTYGVLKVVPSSYQSTVEILIFDPQRQIDQGVQKPISPFVNAVDAVAMNTEIEVIKSKALALRVVKDLGLDHDPEFQPHNMLSVWLERFGLGRWTSEENELLSVWLERFGLGRWTSEENEQIADETDAQRLDAAATALLKHLQAERVPFSYVLSVSASAQNPGKAQRLTETVADDYLASQREARQEALQRVAAWLKGRVDDLQSRVLEAEASIEKLKAQSGIVDTGSNNLNEQQIAELSTQLMAARGDVTEKRAHLDQARRVAQNKGDVQDIPELMSSVATVSLLKQQAELAVREAELRSKFGDGHHELIAVRAELAGINKQLTAEAAHVLGNLQNAYDAAVRREQSLEAGLQKLAGPRSNSANLLKLQQLRRVADADRKLYESYLSQFNEISTRQTLQDASARIITPAAFPEAPSSPRRILFFGFAGVMGTGLGLGLALLLEFLRSGVRSGVEAERVFGYPVVGFIPFVQRRGLRRSHKHGALVRNLVDVPASQFSEAIRSMRIGLRLTNLGEVPKIILITSSIPGEGKSVAAALLAASSAASGQRTVLVDCDLRHKSISAAFAEHKPGLAEILTGTASVSEVTVKHPVPGIYLIPAGSPIANPADLLTSERMRQLVTELRELYDYVVLDASPLLPVIDALTLAALADKILVIAEWNRTPRRDISEALKILRPEAHRIAGIVLNKVDFEQLHSSSGYPSRYFKNYITNG